MMDENINTLNLEQLVKNLKKISSNEIEKEVGDWEIEDETYFLDALILNGTAKRFHLMIEPTKKEGHNSAELLIRRAQVIFRGYTLFVFIKNTLNNSNLKSNSKLLAFKSIFSKPNNKENVSDDNLDGLHTLIRNSISHGTFYFDDSAYIIFKDRKREIKVYAHEFVYLCDEIERFYLKIGGIYDKFSESKTKS